MTNADIKKFFNDIKDLKLKKHEKKRMLRLFQVRGSNRKNKIMTYKEFKHLLLNKKGKITSLVLGPKWNRLVFVDISLEI